MKTLLVDLGNTALKWALADTPEAQRTVVHAGEPGALATLGAAWASEAPARVLACSVATAALRGAVERALPAGSVPLVWLGSQAIHAGAPRLRNAYRDPHQLGPDRWHAALGAAVRFPGEAMLVVHAGTALTVDSVLIEADGAVFAGGRIAPGGALMRASLARGTAGLPLAQGTWSALPDHTDDAIATGVLEAQAGLVDRAAAIMRERGQEPRLVLAGGAAAELAPLLLGRFARASVEHNLVLRGLAVRAADPAPPS
jgi:type III pantothenate kinase